MELTRAMNPHRIAAATAALLAAGALVSCSADHDTAFAPASLGPTVTAPPTPTGAVITDSSTLQAALLTAPGLPPGFAAMADAAPPLERTGPTAAPPPNRSHTDPAECAGVLAPLDQHKGSASHGVARYGGPDFSGIDIDAASYPESGAAQTFAAVQTLFRRCGHYSGTDADGVHVDYRLGALDQPAVGDASTSVRLTTTSDGFTLTSDVVVAVVGSTVVQVAATGQRPIDPKVLTGLATLQVDRLRTVRR